MPKVTGFPPRCAKECQTRERDTAHLRHLRYVLAVYVSDEIMLFLSISFMMRIQKKKGLHGD